MDDSNPLGNTEIVDLTSQSSSGISNLKTSRKTNKTINKRISIVDLTTDSVLDKSVIEDIEGALTKFSCPICFELWISNKVTATICGHLFCTSCIMSVLKTTLHCPTCRRELNKSDLINLLI